MIYDVRTKQAASQTFMDLTGITKRDMLENLSRLYSYNSRNVFIQELIEEYGHIMIRDYTDLTICFSHIATYSDNGDSVKKYGLLDLPSAYRLKDSDLRRFLDAHNIFIDLEDAKLSYVNPMGKSYTYDISYDGKRSLDSAEAIIGYKFYRDFCLCGWFIIPESLNNYSCIDCCPEIICNIDTLIFGKYKRISIEWTNSHIVYVVNAKINGKDIIYPGNENDDPKDRVMFFISKAFDVMIDGESSETQDCLLTQDGVIIPPKNIISIEKFEDKKRHN